MFLPCRTEIFGSASWLAEPMLAGEALVVHLPPRMRYWCWLLLVPNSGPRAAKPHRVEPTSSSCKPRSLADGQIYSFPHSDVFPVPTLSFSALLASHRHVQRRRRYRPAAPLSRADIVQGPPPVTDNGQLAWTVSLSLKSDKLALDSCWPGPKHADAAVLLMFAYRPA